MKVSVMILSCGRLSYFRATMNSFRRYAYDPQVMECVLVDNGSEERVIKYIHSLDFVSYKIFLDRNYGIGRAMNIGAKHLDGEYILNLQNDWECLRHDWLYPAIELLDTFPEVGQVRLRRLNDGQLNTNMLNKEPFEWLNEITVRGERFILGRNCHFVFHPNLMRSEDLRKLLPYREGMGYGHAERGCMLKFDALGMMVAQLKTGAFRHIGANRTVKSSRRWRVVNPPKQMNRAVQLSRSDLMCANGF